MIEAEVQQTITSSIDTVFNIVLGILIITIIGTFIFFIYQRIQYKHTIVIRDTLNKRKIIKVDKFREYIDKKTGVKWYKLLRLKDQIPVAPKESLEIGRKGTLFTEVYRFPTGEYVYLTDENELKEISKDKNFKPITTSQRVIQYHLFENKMKFKRKSWKDLIMPIAAIISMTTIVIMLMVFYGDIAKPLLDMGDKQAKITQTQYEIMEELKQIIQNEQIIKKQDYNSGGGDSEQPPN